MTDNVDKAALDPMAGINELLAKRKDLEDEIADIDKQLSKTKERLDEILGSTGKKKAYAIKGKGKHTMSAAGRAAMSAAAKKRWAAAKKAGKNTL